MAEGSPVGLPALAVVTGGAMCTWGDIWEGDKAHLGCTETEVATGQASQTR